MSSWKGKTRGGVLGYKIFVVILKSAGLLLAYLLLHFLVPCFIIASPKSTRHTFHYFRKILKFNDLLSALNVYRNYYHFGQILLDKTALLGNLKHNLTFTFEGEEFLRRIDNGGKLISGHICNLEIAGQLLNRLVKKVNVILFDAEHEQIKKYLSDVFTNRQVNFIVIKDDYSQLYQIRQALERHETSQHPLK